MHADWRKFLRHQGADFTTESVAHYGDLGAELKNVQDMPVMADLSHAGLIHVDGPDARAFLQGQLSTDVMALAPFTSQLSSWNSSKGRVVTLLRLWDFNDSVYMTLPRSLITAVLKRLSMYVLRSKVKLADVSDNLVLFGIAGHEIPSVLAACGWAAPTEINKVAIKDDAALTRLYGDVPRFVLLGEPEKMMPLWNILKERGVHPVGDDGWVLLRIRAREPALYPETSEHFVAQMLGLEELGAIDFKKGCYLGQEVIARAHYRGGIKRHLQKAKAVSKTILRPGMVLNTTDDNMPAAEIVEARRDAREIWQLLLVVRDEYRNVALRVSDSGDKVEIEPSP